jgi:hypothetical protein
VNTKITMTAIGLLAAGVWLLWPSITAPTIVRASHVCIPVHNDAGCSAHATCTCTALEDNSAVVVLDAGNAGLPPSGSAGRPVRTATCLRVRRARLIRLRRPRTASRTFRMSRHEGKRGRAKRWHRTSALHDMNDQRASSTCDLPVHTLLS